jgi:hypothetical protein
MARATLLVQLLVHAMPALRRSLSEMSPIELHILLHNL